MFAKFRCELNPSNTKVCEQRTEWLWIVPEILGKENIEKKSYLSDIATPKSTISAPLISWFTKWCEKTFIVCGSGFQDFSFLLVFWKETMCNDAEN